MTVSNYTVQLNDTLYGRVVLDEVAASSASAAATAAAAAPPVSGPNASGYTAGQVVDQKAVLVVTGTDANSNPVASPTSLPAVPAFVGNSATVDENG